MQSTAMSYVSSARVLEVTVLHNAGLDLKFRLEL